MSVAYLTFNDLERLQRATRKLLPEAQHMHRLEALARGLGYGSWAAIRKALEAEDVIRAQLLPQSFTDFLQQRNWYVPTATFETACSAAHLEIEESAA